MNQTQSPKHCKERQPLNIGIKFVENILRVFKSFNKKNVIQNYLMNLEELNIPNIPKKFFSHFWSLIVWLTNVMNRKMLSQVRFDQSLEKITFPVDKSSKMKPSENIICISACLYP